MTLPLEPQPARWPHPIRAVAFDMDGLLVNTEELYTQVGTQILQRRGRKFSSQLKNAMTGLPGPQAFALMIERENLTDSVDVLEAESQAIFESILPTQLRLLAGVSELLDHLDQYAVPRCVATSSSARFARTVLTQVGVRERFAFVVTAEDVPRGKPHPDIYQQAAERLGVSPPEMLVLEDSHQVARRDLPAALYDRRPGPHSLDHDFRESTAGRSRCWMRPFERCSRQRIALATGLNRYRMGSFKQKRQAKSS